ncbi:MAG: 50S ribosomal protein L4 [Patescibacteria group bacterium]
MKIKIYDQEGKIASNLEIEKNIFGVKDNPKIISRILYIHQSNKRKPIAQTKDRSQVSGGGRKPFRQKGTGQARAGSNRSPIWVGGGVVFGPTANRNFKKRLPKKISRLGLMIGLSKLAKNGKIIVVSNLNFPKISTAQVQGFLEKLPIEEGKILVVLKDTKVNFELSSANLPYIKTVLLDGLKLEDLYLHNYLLTDKNTIEAIEKRFIEEN